MKKYSKGNNNYVIISVILIVFSVLGYYYISKSEAASNVSYSFKQSSVEGAGFQNVIAVNDDESSIIVGGDVAGFHRWDSVSKRWITSNTGLFDYNDKNVASILFSSNYANSIYAAVGSGQGTGKIYKSTDGGVSWVKKSTAIGFDGGNNDLVPYAYSSASYANEEHPRSVGALISESQNGTDKYQFYAGNTNTSNLVMRVVNDNFTTGSTSFSVSDAGQLRSIASSNSNPDLLFVAAIKSSSATNGGGIFCSNNATSAHSFVKLTNSPSNAEEMTIINGVLYIAAGNQGIYKYNTNLGCGGSVQAINGIAPNEIYIGNSDSTCGAPNPVSVKYISLSGYQRASQTVLYVGVARPIIGSPKNAVYRSTDGGASWQEVVGIQENRMFTGPNTPPLSTGYWNAGQSLDKCSAVVSQIRVIPGADINNDHIYTSGRGGTWISTKSDASGTRIWNPGMTGLAATINKDIIVDPVRNARVYTASTDWFALVSDNGYQTHDKFDTPASGFPHEKTFGLALDHKSSLSSCNSSTGAAGCASLYLANGNRDENVNGRVYYIQDPNPATYTPSMLVDLDLQTAAGGNTPTGIAVGRDATGNRIVIVAVAEGNATNSGTLNKGGIYKKVGSNAWSRVYPSSGADSEISGGANGGKANGKIKIHWVMDTGGNYTSKVYLYSSVSGLWVSNDYGNNWSNASPGFEGVTNATAGSTDKSYSLAIDSTNNNVVYYTKPNGVFRVTVNTTNSSSSITSQILTATSVNSDAGQLAIDTGGNLYVTYGATESNKAGIKVSANPNATSVNFSDLTFTNTIDKSTIEGTLAASPVEKFVIDKQNNMYMSFDGNGVLIGTPKINNSNSKNPNINGDPNNTVNIYDLSILISRWGTNDASADLNSNGIVDISDLSILIQNWTTV